MCFFVDFGNRMGQRIQSFTTRINSKKEGRIAASLFQKLSSQYFPVTLAVEPLRNISGTRNCHGGDSSRPGTSQQFAY